VLQGTDSTEQWVKDPFSIDSKNFSTGFAAEPGAHEWNQSRAERFGSVYKKSSERTIVFYL